MVMLLLTACIIIIMFSAMTSLEDTEALVAPARSVGTGEF